MPTSSTITLDHSRRTISLERLDQALTYYGLYHELLDGLPTTELNERLIADALEKATELAEGAAPYLIKPTEIPMTYRRGEKYPFGNPARLPNVMCWGLFFDPLPVRDLSKHYSSLVIVWFQEDFALPLDPEVERQIKAMDWMNLAHEYEW